MATFLDRVGGFGPRQEAASLLQVALFGSKPDTNVDSAPHETFRRVRALMEARGISHREMASLRGTTYGGSAHFRFAPSRRVLAGYADLLDDQGLRDIATSDLFWDRVVAVEPAGEEDVYDLTVPGPASWLADAVVSHNSGAIEQDSDVVMFIHRDDSAEDLTRKGTADLIVAKHRNGPTDTIKLTFLPHLTQFRNYAPGA